jgi:hypothetical protein
MPSSAVMSTPLVAVHPDESFDDAVQIAPRRMPRHPAHHLRA